MRTPTGVLAMFRNHHTLSLFFMLTLGVQAAAGDVGYSVGIKPLFAEKCSACHGVLKQEAGLRLDHGELVRRGGDDGEVIDVEDVVASKLLERVTSDDESIRMPPLDVGEPLTKDQVRLLREWIASGAKSPDNESIPVGPDQHWAWQPPERTHVVTPANSDWSENPIDAFVFAKLQERGLEPFPVADRRTRLRRLYFDLIGLPPTPKQQRAFLEDTSNDAWLNVVNRLLDDPTHAERWARHWMDVWRYSDWNGYKDQVRGSQRHIWRWRDWIVESLNADKGYDQMIVEMLAGDEIAPTNPDVLRATGFLARNFHNSNRNIWLDATVEHTAKAFLAMTVNCARCHDHKYDPISQEEYYSFRAIFEPHHVRTERLPGEPDVMKDGLVRAFDAQPEAPTYLFAGGNEKLPDEDHPMRSATPSILGLPLDIVEVELPIEAVFPSLQGFVEREDIAISRKKLADARDLLAGLESDESSRESDIARQTLRAAEADLSSLVKRWEADKTKYRDGASDDAVEQARLAAVSAEHQAKIENAKLTLLKKQQEFAVAKASVEKERDEKQSAVDKAAKEAKEAKEKLAALGDSPAAESQYTSVGKVYPATSTGRRLALARWITRADNPVTARVAVNYLWMYHFGEPLVSNVFDFGLRSPEPPHRALLDWLAIELIEHDWSMKHLHRLITTSRTYQLASSDSDNDRWAANHRLDGDNRLLWRANVRRLEAEVVRDSLLYVAGNLDDAYGGPEIDFKQGEVVPRRSLYFRHAYEKQMTMLVLFDAAAPTECYRRSPSIIPQQALAIANSPLAFDQARSLATNLAARVCKSGICDLDHNRSFVRAAFKILLSRDCSESELQACTDFLAKQASVLSNDSKLTPLPGNSKSQRDPAKDAAQRARENLIHTLMNHNDFVTVR